MDSLLHHLLVASARRFPDKEALVHNDHRLTYSEVLSKVTAIAIALRRSGVERGNRLGVYLDPGIPQVLSIFAVTMAGGVVVPINTQLLPAQVHHIASDCRISVLITSASKLSSLRPYLDKISSLRFVVVV